MTELERFKELERLRKERDRLFEIADSLSQTDDAWLDLTKDIEKINQQIAKLEEENQHEND